MPKWTSSSALGNSLVYDNGTNIGIGTTSPSEKLAVNGNIALPKSGNTFIYNDQSGSDSVTIGGAQYFSVKTFNGANYVEVLRATANAKVGIGTTNPIYSLDLIGQIIETASINSVGTDTRLYIQNTTTGSANNNGLMVGMISNDSYLFNYQNGNSIFGTNATERMRITSAGNVGIGTTSPLVALDVRGTVIITNQTGGNYNENLRLPESTSGYASITLGGSIAASGTSAAQWTLVKFPTSNNFSIRNNSSDHITVFPTGNLAIGNSTDAGYKLDVVNGAIRIVYSTFAGIEYHNTAGTWEGYIGTESGSGNLRYNSRQGAHTWYNNSSATMTLTSGGNLGIGTTSPTYSLQLGSNIGISTTSAYTLNYINFYALTAGQGICASFNPNGTPTGYGYNFQFSKSTSANSNSLLIIGGGSSAGGNSANKHVISTSSDGAATGQPLVLRVAPSSTSWSAVNDYFTIFPTGNVVIQSGSASATDAGYKFDVNGTARINSTLSLTNSSFAGTFSFFLSAANTMQASSSNIGTWLQVGGGNTVSIVGQAFNSTARGNSFGNTVGGEAISATTIIAQSSGTTATAGLSLRYTINNTGTYVGTTRGIYYNPTVTSLTGTTHYAIETVVGDVILGSTSGNVGIGTATLGTATRLTLGGSQTASSAIARGGLVNTTLVAAANNDVLVGLDIAPTFTNGAFTGVINYGIRTSGDIAFASAANRYLTMQSPSTSGSGGNIIIQSGSANTSGTGGNVYLYVGGGAGGPGPGKIYIGNNNGWDVAYVTGILTVSSTGPNTGDVLRVSGGGRNALTIAWDNLTPFMSYSLVSGRQSRFLNSSSYYFDNNFLIGTTTDGGYKLSVNGNGNFILGNSGYIRLQSGSGQRHGYIQSAFSNFLFSNNIYYDGSNWRYDQNGYGAQIQTETLSVGVIAFNTFASGTGGGIATIIESMRIVNNGNILMGDTNDLGFKLQVTGSSIFSDTIIQDYGNNSSALSGITSYINQSTLDNNYSNGSYSGETISGQLASTVIAGQVVAMRASTLQWELANASTAASTGKNMLGIACYGGNGGDTITILLRGFFASDTYYNNSGNYGVPMYLNAGTSGSLTDVAPSTTGNIVRIVGHIDNYNNSNSCAVLRFNPDNSWLVI
jgi:hypothetical protein